NMDGIRNTHDFSKMELGAPSFDLQENYARGRDAKRAMQHAAQEANPNTFLAGEVGGGIATSMIPGLNVAKGANFAARAGQAAAMGGATGLGMSEEDNIGGLAKDAAIGAGLGAGMQ